MILPVIEQSDHSGSHDQIHWNPFEKLPADVCPEKYCWWWADIGWHVDMSDNTYDDIETAMNSCVPVEKPGCYCGFGVCKRIAPHLSDTDWYEPIEPELEKDGLPWFYFMPQKYTWWRMILWKARILVFRRSKYSSYND